jgi:L-asparaginase / beta-aspartyl-peptidase
MQVAIELQGQVELYALDAYLFKKFFLKVWKLTELLRATAGVSHCGFVSRGDFQSTIIPVYGKGPTRINSYQKDITATHAVLTNGCSRTGAGLQSNNVQTSLRGDRGGMQKRAQSDDKHFARYLFDQSSSRPLEIEVSSLDEASTNDNRNAETEWTSLLQATWELMQRVKDEYKVNKFGFMIKPAEKYDVCIALVPTVFSDPSLEMIPSPETFQETYPGYLTDDLGPLTSKFQDMSANAAILRKSLRESNRVSPPGSWRIPETHSLDVLRSPWYSAIAFVQDSFYHASVNFFGQQLGYKYALVPLTTDCISSPMGLGSDSVPARILLHGGETFLADSMQFSLEYMPRVVEGCKGFYYLSPSFRGEDHDSSRLNQFYHLECELRGTLDDGIRVMEQFVFAVTQTIWGKSRQVIESIVEDTSHIQELLNHSSSDTAFPRVTLEEAIRILSGTNGTWEFVLPDNPEKGKKLTRRGERALMEQYGGIVWVTHMDHLSVPFYQAYADDSCTKARCADLLIGIGEAGGLGERHITPGAGKLRSQAA